MNKNALIHSLCFVIALILLAPGAAAQDQPPKLSEMWLVGPLDGHEMEFNAGVKAHMTFRHEQGDPRAWQAYSPLLGDRLNQLAVRYCCVTWADVDAYRQWEADNPKVQAHFEEHVAPHLGTAAHLFESVDWANSHWNEANGPYRLFAVTEFEVKPENSGDFDTTRVKMSQIAIQNGWASDDRSWIWLSSIGGAPTHSIVVPHRNFASLEGDERTFAQFLAEHLGSAEKAAELMQEFMASAEAIDYQLWEHQPGLSMPENE